jgi:hypothetical protein
LPQQAIRRIRNAGVPVLGVITNSRQLRREGGDSQVYGYGGYNYGVYGGYGGYGGYGYQSYANDPLLAYSYYDAERRTRPNSEEKGWKKIVPTPAKLQRGVRRLGNNINNWLDE